MKPIQGEIVRVSKCRCCVSTYSKHASGSKGSARESIKQKVRKEIMEAIDKPKDDQ